MSEPKMALVESIVSAAGRRFCCHEPHWCCMSNFDDPNQQFFPQQPSDQPPRRSNSGLIIASTILGSVALVMLACCGGGYFLYLKINDGIRELGSEAGRAAAIAAVENSDFSAEDKQEITAQIDRVANGYKSGDIELAKAMDVMVKLGNSPLFSLAALRSVQEKYVKPAGLPEQEKDDALLTIGRVSRGIVEKSIQPVRLEALNDKHLMVVEEVQSEVNDEEMRKIKEFKVKVTDDELRAYLVELKLLADDASVPEEPYEPDVGGEFKRIVDEALEK
jgi:hypothetical protein